MRGLIIAVAVLSTAAHAQTLTTLYNFCSQTNCTDGENPVSPLVQGPDGTLYGTAAAGGNGYGTVFKFTTPNLLPVLHTYAGSDGAPSGAGLILGPDGNFSGTNAANFPASSCLIFKMTPSG